MPDEPAGNDVAAQAQNAGAEILARLDELTQQSVAAEDTPAVEALEKQKKRLQATMKKIDDIVAEYEAELKVQLLAEEESRAAAAENTAQEKIEEIKKGIGAQ